MSVCMVSGRKARSSILFFALRGLVQAAVVLSAAIASGTGADAQTVIPDGLIVDNGLLVNSGDILSNSGNIFTLTGSVGTVAGSIFSNTGDIFTNTGTISTNTGDITTNEGDIATNTGNVITNTGDIASLNGTVSGQTLSDNGGTTVTSGVVTTNDVKSATGTFSGLLQAGAGLAVTGGVLTAPVAQIATVTSTTTNTATVNATATNTRTVNSTTINNSGTTTTGALAVGTGGVSVAAGAPVSFGGNRVQNVGTPIAATDAANKGYVDAALGSSTARIDQAFRDNDNNTEGVAIVIALGGIALPHDKTFAIAGNIGFYDDKQALAAQAAIRLDSITTFNAGIGVGLDNSRVGGRVGLMAPW